MVQRGSELHFSGNEECKPFKVKLDEVISRDPAMVGRSTLVLKATSKQWPGTPLVVKISWPTSNRASETEFLKLANGKAKGDHKWAAKHLPQVHYAEDVLFSADSTLESVARLFDNAEFADNSKDYVYERRTLRIIIQERLYPLKSLASVKDIGQVLLDIACGMCVPSASRLVSTHHGSFSSSLALRTCWDPSSRPQSQQYHVPLHQGEERGREKGAESLRSADRL